MNNKTIFISIHLLPCVIAYLIMMYGGIIGLKRKDFGLEKYLKKSSNATEKNAIPYGGLYFILIVSSILFTVTDIMVLNNIGSLQDSQLTKILLGICIIPQCIVTLAFGLYYDYYFTQIILLGSDLKSLKPLTIIGILCLYIMGIHLSIFLAAFSK
ncbi:cellulose synthase/poly-beta-1,6-N-acetylglucosamine synthase-like glycosyltransferase [Sphingobacterium sp. BIGb0116]|nr:cellulose synthase/poly-beta-1,6-N-acetylglucosamine synthase-like glycosyltransferase [Sphingobacterium sp. BIGb0116]